MVDDVADLDVGWDFSAYSSSVNTRETKPPPPAKTPSKLPTRPPAAPSKPASRRPAAGAGKRPALRKVSDRKPEPR
ncbi:hypothetical protein BH11MYX4_BH11MYX4_59860 [soil metagenome]